MKVVLDTDVIVSGLLSPFGPAGQIIRQIASGDLELCYDARILSEYKSVLVREKFPFIRESIEDFLDQIKVNGNLSTGKPLVKRLPDKDDEPFLEVALACGTKYLVTGNLKHYPTKMREGILVLSPAEFLEIYRKNPAE